MEKEPAVVRVLILGRLLRSALEEGAVEVTPEFLVDLDGVIALAESQVVEAT